MTCVCLCIILQSFALHCQRALFFFRWYKSFADRPYNPHADAIPALGYHPNAHIPLR